MRKPCISGGGSCINTFTTTCGGSLVANLCPGTSEYKCCRSSPSDKPCIGGTCKNIYSDTCIGSYAPGLCSGPSNIQCCKTVEPGGGGLTYPVKGERLQATLNFGEIRDASKNCPSGRCHVGCDLQQGTAVAIADGYVTAKYNFNAGCSGGDVYAILIYHPSLDITVNYGEIDWGDTSVKAGSNVRQGDPVGYASRCKMLYFEVYTGKVTANQAWCRSASQPLSPGENCMVKYPRGKPAAVMNCAEFLRKHFS